MTSKLYYLSNKIPVIIHNTSFQTCGILISLNFGACDEKAQEYGITHFIEHILGQSVTGDLSFKNLKQNIELFGGKINLYTNYEKIACSINILPEHLINIIKLIAPQITNPLFDIKKIEQEKRVIISEYKRFVDNNSWQSFKFKQLFHGTGLEHPILGTPETILSFTPEKLSQYYFSHLSNDKINIVIVGKVYDVKQVLSELENAFGKIPFVSYQRKLSSVLPTIKHDSKPDVTNIKLGLAFAANLSHERKNKLAVGLFRKILQDRLMNILRYETGLVYSIQCLTMGTQDTKLYTIETETSTHNIENVVKNIALVCHDIINKNPITIEELQTAKNVIKFQLASMMDSVDKTCNLYAQHIEHYHKLYNIDSEVRILDKIQQSDINNIALIFLESPLSIVTQGTDAGCDIMKIWNDFFRNAC
ncbi:MAG: insulinase family protein [Alphaproteobacteria bacterium]|nr:insulinase family protein [Alphaproteobacteria bacterium]